MIFTPCRLFSKSVFDVARKTTKMPFSIVEKGAMFTENYRIFFKNDENLISPMHDIPLFPGGEQKIVNMVVEIPRWSNAKMEINLKESLNPIRQDMKNGLPRFVPNCFPYHGYIWNYGALPQTWEDPNIIDENTKCKGDNDPIDCIEIGQRVAKRGEVMQVKVLGTVALIDEGETDWKIIVINTQDPLAEAINSIAEIEKHRPGLMKATIEWFKIYKIPDGKPENQFAFNGEPKSVEFALKIIAEVHEHWKKLINGETEAKDISLTHTTLPDKEGLISTTEAESTVANYPGTLQPKELDPIVDKWHFVHLKY